MQGGAGIDQAVEGKKATHPPPCKILRQTSPLQRVALCCLRRGERPAAGVFALAVRERVCWCGFAFLCWSLVVMFVAELFVAV
jgi:hypothetical protein